MHVDTTAVYKMCMYPNALVQDLDFSQTTPTKQDLHHPPHAVDVKEMNFDPLIPASSGGSGSGGLLGGMEIRQHQNKSPTLQGEINTPPTIPPTNSTRYNLY